jgi:NAD(P)-dependent dehydrogenase (short-subunit alcohol dehydrogenase family)
MPEDLPMNGKVVVVTGATSGIGAVAAHRLADKGARIVFVARDKDRGEALLGTLGGRGHRMHIADLSRIAEMKRVAAEIAHREPRIDVLVNNAGAMFNRRVVTADGLEMTFALNHLSYFVMARGLRENLIAATPARIVSTASAAHLGQRLDFDDLQSRNNYRGFRTYGRSKLANILFTRELARSLEGTGVTANCLHPGFVATRFGDNSGGFLGSAFKVLKTFALTPEQGADTIVYLAVAPGVAAISGRYFAKRRPVTPSSAARDDGAARRLWTESAALAGFTNEGVLAS